MSPHTVLETMKNARRLVIKIGSALLVDDGPDGLRSSWLNSIVDDIAKLKSDGVDVIVVSSGAVAMGLPAMGFDTRPTRLEDAQAAAAVGQIRLAQAYQARFDRYDITTAQVLLTLDDMENRRRYLNARNTIKALLDKGAVPVINENDTVATAELRFGDNDRLAARVAQMVGADALVLLSDIDGLYDSDPHLNKDAQLLEVVNDITPEIEAMAGPCPISTPGSGGMITKVAAAKIALAGGCSMIIMNGTQDHPITRLNDGERATLFPATSDPLTVKKRWIRGMMAAKGQLHVDAGAVGALGKGASLLPAGVTSTKGAFERGDLVEIMSPDGRVVAQGLVSYDAKDARQIAGLKSDAISNILGYAARAALVHRDDMVLL